MRILTVLGTRPEVIRLAPTIERLDACCEHVLVHTGQNYTPELHANVFTELGVRAPDYALEARGERWGERVAAILDGIDAVLRECRPDRVLILGDTDSGLSALVAKRLGIPVFHMEAGNRCYDERVPEESNRRVIDHLSDVLLPYTAGSRENLLREGFPAERILVTGNPIREVMLRHAAAMERSDVLDRLGLSAGGYFLVTAHRQETVDVPQRLASLMRAVEAAARSWSLPAVWSVHPRTRHRLQEAGFNADARSDERADLRFCPPFGFADFLRLERDARCVLSDSGTVQEEACLLGVPAVTLRDTTERPETVACGSNRVTGVEVEPVLAGLAEALAAPRDWTPPAEYLVTDVSRIVVDLLLDGMPPARTPAAVRGASPLPASE